MNATYFLDLAVVLMTILVSMTLHEAMHGFASYWLGDDTAKLQGRLTLNPLAHIDLFTTILLPLALFSVGLPPFGAAKPVPFNPYKVRFGDLGAALVAIAGPITNLVLAFLGGIALHFISGYPDPSLQGVINIFIVVNVSFFLFNMIPFPPLDGSRLIYALAPDFVRTLMERVEAMGFAAIILFMVLFYSFLTAPFIGALDALVRLISNI